MSNFGLHPTVSCDGEGILLDDLNITFHRSLRLPDHGAISDLAPVSYGSYELRDTRDSSVKLPSTMARTGGALLAIPREPIMHIQGRITNLDTGNEAVSLRFSSTKPYAVRVYAGDVNAISGRQISEERANSAKPKTIRRQFSQDYIIVPDQDWLQGFAVEPGVARQFVALPANSGHSAEFQMSGQDCYMGMLFAVTPVIEPRYTIHVISETMLPSAGHFLSTTAPQYGICCFCLKVRKAPLLNTCV